MTFEFSTITANFDEFFIKNFPIEFNITITWTFKKIVLILITESRYHICKDCKEISIVEY